MEGGRDGRDGRKEGWKERVREGQREGQREGGREGGSEGGAEGGMEGGMEGGREGWRRLSCIFKNNGFHFLPLTGKVSAIGLSCPIGRHDTLTPHHLTPHISHYMHT